jgi:hypothetical protein
MRYFALKGQAHENRNRIRLVHSSAAGICLALVLWRRSYVELGRIH